MFFNEHMILFGNHYKSLYEGITLKAGNAAATAAIWQPGAVGRHFEDAIFHHGVPGVPYAALANSKANSLWFEVFCEISVAYAREHFLRLYLDWYLVMYAYIYYVDDGVKRIVPISDIKGFFPKNIDDFGNSIHVKALWKGARNEIPPASAERFRALAWVKFRSKVSFCKNFVHKRGLFSSQIFWNIIL